MANSAEIIMVVMKAAVLGCGSHRELLLESRAKLCSCGVGGRDLWKGPYACVATLQQGPV